MNWALIADILAAAFFIAGALLLLLTAIGLLRFPELLSRMHAGTKPQVLGLILMMNGLALSLRTATVTWTLLLVVAVQLIAAPVSAHMVGRAGYRTQKIREDLLVLDEYAEDLAEVERRVEEAARERRASS